MHFCVFYCDIRLSAFECDLQRVDSRTGWWPILWRHETRRYAADMQWTTVPCHVSLFFTQLDHSAKSFIFSSHWIKSAFHLAWRRGYVYVRPFGLYNVAVSNISCSHHILFADYIFNNLQTLSDDKNCMPCLPGQNFVLEDQVMKLITWFLLLVLQKPLMKCVTDINFKIALKLSKDMSRFPQNSSWPIRVSTDGGKGLGNTAQEAVERRGTGSDASSAYVVPPTANRLSSMTSTALVRTKRNPSLRPRVRLTCTVNPMTTGKQENGRRLVREDVRHTELCDMVHISMLCYDIGGIILLIQFDLTCIYES